MPAPAKGRQKVETKQIQSRFNPTMEEYIDQCVLLGDIGDNRSEVIKRAVQDLVRSLIKEGRLQSIKLPAPKRKRGTE